MNELFEVYRQPIIKIKEDGTKNITRSHVEPYLGLLKDQPLYPVIYDANNVVLSLPPIINGEHSKMTGNMKHIFIESTGTDYTKLTKSLNTLIACFSCYC